MTDLPHYYDTTNELVRIDEYEEKAASQNDRILAFFKAHPGQAFTPAEVWKALDPDGISPITSYRRSITNLTKRGLLIHLKEEKDKKNGIYGRSNDTWIYPMEVTQGKLF